MKIIDTHCHLYDERFADDLSEVIEKCKRNGIVCCYENSDSFEAFEKILEHRKKDPVFFRPVLGIHPEFAKKSDAYLEEAYAFIRQHRSEIAAIGEIGLDYHYEKDERTKERQKKVFVDQISSYTVGMRIWTPIRLWQRRSRRESICIAIPVPGRWRSDILICRSNSTSGSAVF